MTRINKVTLEQRLRALLENIRVLHKAALSAECSYFNKREALAKWVDAEVRTLSTLLDGLNGLTPGELLAVTPLLYLEERAVWLIKSHLLTRVTRNPIHFVPRNGHDIHESFENLIKLLDPKCFLTQDPAQVETALERFKTCLETELVRLRGLGYIPTGVSVDEFDWLTKDSLTAFKERITAG